MKGIILAGGSGTRLRPMTTCVNKHLLPVYDKPMVFYPLATLMQAGIREVLVITNPEDEPAYRALLGDGQQWGMRLAYATQDRPEGIAQAFLIGESYINGQGCALVLGDNIFDCETLPLLTQHAAKRTQGATVFAKRVPDPERFGVVTFDDQNHAVRLEEKPRHPHSNWAVTGLYFYDAQIVNIAKSLRPSARGELEITAVNEAYMQRGQLRVELLGETAAWLDTGTPDSLLEAALYVQNKAVIHQQQVACLDEIAFQQGFIDGETLAANAAAYCKTPYGAYIAAKAEAALAALDGEMMGAGMPPRQLARTHI